MEVVLDFGKIGFLSLLVGAIFWDSEMHLGSLFEAWKVESWDLSARVQLSEAVIGFVRLLNGDWFRRVIPSPMSNIAMSDACESKCELLDYLSFKDPVI